MWETGMSEWLELELAERLAPVRAPERLWYLVQEPAPATAPRRSMKTALLVAAVAAASVLVAVAWRPETRSAQPLAIRANSATAHMGCRSCHIE